MRRLRPQAQAAIEAAVVDATETVVAVAAEMVAEETAIEAVAAVAAGIGTDLSPIETTGPAERWSIPTFSLLHARTTRTPGSARDDSRDRSGGATETVAPPFCFTTLEPYLLEQVSVDLALQLVVEGIRDAPDSIEAGVP